MNRYGFFNLFFIQALPRLASHRERNVYCSTLQPRSRYVCTISIFLARDVAVAVAVHELLEQEEVLSNVGIGEIKTRVQGAVDMRIRGEYHCDHPVRGFTAAQAAYGDEDRYSKQYIIFQLQFSQSIP